MITHHQHPPSCDSACDTPNSPPNQASVQITVVDCRMTLSCRFIGLFCHYHAVLLWKRASLAVTQIVSKGGYRLSSVALYFINPALRIYFCVCEIHFLQFIFIICYKHLYSKLNLIFKKVSSFFISLDAPLIQTVTRRTRKYAYSYGTFSIEYAVFCSASQASVEEIGPSRDTFRVARLATRLH